MRMLALLFVIIQVCVSGVECNVTGTHMVCSRRRRDLLSHHSSQAISSIQKAKMWAELRKVQPPLSRPFSLSKTHASLTF